MIRGFIFDVYPDYRKDVMVTWLLTKQGAVSIEEPYHPDFFVSASKSNLQDLVTYLQQLPDINHIQFKQKKTKLASDQTHHVLQITPSSLSHFHPLAKQIDRWGKYHIYQLYNVDLRIPTRYLHHHGLFFNAFVSVDNKRFSLHDDQWAIDYEVPSFSVTTLHVEQSKKPALFSFENPITTITIDDACFQEENEVDTILTAVRHIQKQNPDIVFTQQGDSIAFPFLLKRAEKKGITKHLIFGRDTKKHLYPMKQESSYLSYGRVLHRPAFYMLAGRIHIDTTHSFFHGEGGLSGLIDLSRCSNISFQLLSRLGPGTAISQIQVNTALDQGYLIPWKKTRPEIWKTAAHLLASDRGGLILDPVVGLHENVIELDFASLYPNIMVLYNISPETMLCSCCLPSDQQVPQLGYHICVKKEGLLPTVLKPILQRRFLFKARSKNKMYDQQRYAKLQQTWKWVLIVCFGYTGYRNARYGRIECHESITAFSRDILIKAIEMVESAGYQVLHGIVDSLWIQPKSPSIKPLQLARMISMKTGIRIEMEGIFHWIVFLPSKGTGVGALNRYYGLYDHGEIKTRGIELRQHNTPFFFKEVQKQMLQVFSEATDASAFAQLISPAVQVLLNAGKDIHTGCIHPNDVVFTTRISKQISSYKVENVVKAALQQLAQYDIHLQPGQLLRYIVQNSKAKHFSEKVCIQELVTDETPIDVRFYLHFLARCGETLLLPFGYTADMFEQMLLHQWKQGGGL
jgi:DNA polymerase elongation subunit (family B)